MKPRIAVTRAAGNNGALNEALMRLGAVPVEAPLITYEPVASADLDKACERVAAGIYAAIAFTSPEGVRALSRLAPALSQATTPVLIAAVGPATRRALSERGIETQLSPPHSEPASAVALLNIWPVSPSRERVLLPRSDLARPMLPTGMRERGWVVDELTVYRTVPVVQTPQLSQALSIPNVDAVILASPSTVRSFARIDGATRIPVACIGNPTETEARALGFDTVVVASATNPHSLAVAAVTAANTSHGNAARQQET